MTENTESGLVAHDNNLHVPQRGLALMDFKDFSVRVNAIKRLMKEHMQEGTHYGMPFGATDGKDNGKDKPKPMLYKAGSELICVLFCLVPQYQITKTELENGHREYTTITNLLHNGVVVGQGIGLCSTMEKKYKCRYAQRECPECKSPAIIKGKPGYGGGWICFTKKGGCGAKFLIDDPKIVGQKLGVVENPDLADSYNTVLKVSKKRSVSDGVLSTTAASEIFLPFDDEPDDDESGNTPGQEPPTSPDTFTEQPAKFIYNIDTMDDQRRPKAEAYLKSQGAWQENTGSDWFTTHEIANLENFKVGVL